MGFLRIWLGFFVVLVVAHLVLRVWLRLRERHRLAEEWERAGTPGNREGFVRAGLASYDRSFRKRLLWLTIVGPMVGLALLLYLVNES